MILIIVRGAKQRAEHNKARETSNERQKMNRSFSHRFYEVRKPEPAQRVQEK